MGRGRGGGGRGRGGFRGKNKKGGDRRDVRTEPWSDIRRENALFESYYKTGGFLDEKEFEQMWKYMASDLPNSFRFTGTKADALAVREIFKKRYIPAITAVEFEGEPVQPPEPVKAFPDELVWHMKTHKKVIRRYKPFAEFQRFLVAETTAGNISRQEVVSMIPPHFLDVRPGMVVLDMCAAPGSKSAQLAEMIHGDEEERVKRAASNESFNATDDGDYSDDGRSTGLLIANDTDYKRAGMLVHQVKRLNFPNLIVTQHDASIFPSIEMPPAPGSTKPQYLKFDRVLADVPCSGDGTARKNPNVWQKWTPRDGLGLHNLQLRILMRGLQLLKKGGRLVYSTCSLNPVENEAVVASAIQACGGTSKVQLVDCSNALPELIRKPGLNQWKVLDTSHINGEEKINHMFTSYESFLNTKEKYEKEEPARQFSNKITRSVFPPVDAPSEAERIPLERCVRVYPHLQDTGGFFIAVLEKLDDIKVAQPGASSKGKAGSTDATPVPVQASEHSDATPQLSAEDAVPSAPSPTKRKLEDTEDDAASKRFRTETEDPAQDATNKDGTTTSEPVNDTTSSTPGPNGTSQTPQPRLKSESQSQKEYFEYLPKDDPTVSDILSFFGISPRFPRDRFLVRNKEGLALNKMYYTSELAKTIITHNKDRGMRFIHCGVVMFVSHKIKDKDAMKAPWRLQNEGIKILEPWAGKRIITCKSRDEFYRLLIEMFPKLPKDGSHELGEVGEQLMQLDIGCCFLRIEQDESQGFPFRMVLPVWRHPGSANLMVDKDDRKAMLLRLFNEENPRIINHVMEKAKEEAEKESAEATEEAEGETEAKEEDTEMGDAPVGTE
ncbi:S-adenosyl-L-methionine-dependent methyltransferase [Westerdykella ornata]|uniref:S-adenosyl-L-methionine-dependent methyltransferase n=1 Tax=Westerdykella ornata TaxID=318751 RepID=A0A6A6JN86_WESOR|nr:S-adenosyl-L-methionine-dependent methyltransferase [Westerdykella ornata]KAF2277116.1 S-adenosyl-L-methionine-dependent methyltransferase [Westerdykella ornata]